MTTTKEKFIQIPLEDAKGIISLFCILLNHSSDHISSEGKSGLQNYLVKLRAKVLLEEEN